MVPGINVEQFSNEFQSLLSLTPLARVSFLEICNENNLYLDLEEISFFMAADEIAGYLRKQVLGQYSEISKIFEYLSSI